MSKIKVVHYCNQLSLGGTEKTMELFCKYLNKDKFEVYAVSRFHRVPLKQKIKVGFGRLVFNSAARGKRKLWKSMNARIPNFISILGENRVVFSKNDEHLKELLYQLKPDILHVHYSGNPELPINDEGLMSEIPAVVTTNQFEVENTAPSHRHVKKMFFVSKWLLKNKAHWAEKDPRSDIMYNPVEKPKSEKNLRLLYNIPNDAFVIGRVGRPDNGIFDPISLLAYAKIQNKKTYFLALSPPENMLKEAKRLGLKNFISIAPTTDEVFLSEFYNTIDVLAHARRDGETFGCNIAEAMVHGKPVISHLTPFMNAQKEVIGDTGFVVEQGDWSTYADKLNLLMNDKKLFAELSEKSKTRALAEFEAAALTRRLETVYLNLVKNR